MGVQGMMKGKRASGPLREWLASARSTAECMNHPAAPLVAVRRMLANRPMRVIRLPLSSGQDYYKSVRLY